MDARIIVKSDGRVKNRRNGFRFNSWAYAEKNELQPHRRKCWVIPPEQNGEFVARMEDVLDIYSWQYDGKYPVVCMDEQPTQLVKETRQPLPCEVGKPAKYDYEYLVASSRMSPRLVNSFLPKASKAAVSAASCSSS